MNDVDVLCCPFEGLHPPHCLRRDLHIVIIAGVTHPDVESFGHLNDEAVRGKRGTIQRLQGRRSSYILPNQKLWIVKRMIGDIIYPKIFLNR